MCPFDLSASLERAQRRFGASTRFSKRSPRSDRGVSRLDPRVLALVSNEVSGYERPKMARALSRISERCHSRGLPPPSRATVYKLLDMLPTRLYSWAELPPAVRDALYNMGPGSRVPAHQVAFYCFNYGDLAAMSFASGLPWMALHQALRVPGFRAKSRGLMAAVARARGV